ncbi:MAG: hypothetical protein JWN18_51 [Parcubacteria group bacterium]|nr:hypothetical protein [Parcubacteria group bacterium]
MNTTNKRIIIAVIVILLVAGGLWFMTTRSSNTSDTLGTPDNSGQADQVTKNGQSVTTKTTTTTATSSPADVTGQIEIGMNQTGGAFGVTITPDQVVEDSRCPTDVKCIQAGTVRVHVLFNGVTSQTIAIGDRITLGGEAVTLLQVKPAKVSTVTLKNSDYRFVFKIEQP